MPFTPSHAVVALPLLRTPLVPGAVAIGAMTPDLPLFLRGIGLGYGFTHALANVVWTALVALGLFLLWRVLLRPAAGELAPTWVSRRMPEEWCSAPRNAAAEALGRGTGVRGPVALAASLLLGVLSHIGWDLFTHEGRSGTEWLPVLDAMWGPMPGYRWLQHASSVLGVMILAVAGLIWLRRRRPGAVPDRMLPTWARATWWSSLPVILLAAWQVGLAMLGPLDEEFTARHLAYRALPPACAVWGILTIVLCALLAVRRARSDARRRQVPPRDTPGRRS